MNQNSFSPDSRVWVYQSSRVFSPDEIALLNRQLEIFARQWTAHNVQLQATGFVSDGSILILMVDESHAGASGCSIDTSVHFIKSIEKEFNCSLFDRTIVNYFDNNEIHSTSLTALSDQYKNGVINDQTLVIDPLVQTKATFDAGFKKPLSQSWLYSFAKSA